MNTTVARPTEIDLAALPVPELRLPQLLDMVAEWALCTSTAPGTPLPEDWHRADRESAADWRDRQDGLRAVCAACPVRLACEESALRQGEGGPEGSVLGLDGLVRGGRTGAELYAARIAQAERLAAAAEEDDRACQEERELRLLTARLRNQALMRPTKQNSEQNSADIRDTVGKIAVIRAARQGRSGWSSAA